MKLSIASILLLLIFISARAQQSIDLFTISGRYAMPRAYDHTYSGKATETGALVNIKLPIVFSEKTIWYNDLLYSPAVITNNETMPEGIANPIVVHGFILQTGLVKKLANNTALQILLVPRFMTDFADVNRKNWQLGGIVLFEKRYHDNLMMRFGMLYNQERFGPILTPLVHLDWQFAPKWSFVGLLPIYAKINYQANENTVVGLSYFGLTTTYRLGNIAYRDDYIERFSIDMALFLRQRLFGNVHLEGRVGHTIDRQYEQYAEDQKLDLRIILFDFGDNRVAKNVDFKDGMFANLRLVYSLPL